MTSDELEQEARELVEHVEEEMDVREIIDVLCTVREDSRVREELAVEVAVEAGRDRGQVTRAVNEYISLVEVVELEDGYIQTRRHFDERHG